jgi:broad specificity phosphatase PhoE
VADRLAHHQVAAVYSSPLARTMETARIVAVRHGLDVMPSDSLLDLDYGDWQGKTPEQAEAINKVRYAAWLSRPARVRIPRGERLTSLRRRVVKVIKEVAERHPGEAVVLVSHDMVGRVLMTGLLNLPLDAIWQIAQDNAAVNMFEMRGDRFVVLTLNDTGHLDRTR